MYKLAICNTLFTSGLASGTGYRIFGITHSPEVYCGSAFFLIPHVEKVIPCKQDFQKQIISTLHVNCYSISSVLC